MGASAISIVAARATIVSVVVSIRVARAVARLAGTSEAIFHRAGVRTAIVRDGVAVVAGLIAGNDAITAFRGAGTWISGAVEAVLDGAGRRTAIIRRVVAVIAGLGTDYLSIAAIGGALAGFTAAAEAAFDDAKVRAAITHRQVAIVASLGTFNGAVAANDRMANAELSHASDADEARLHLTSIRATVAGRSAAVIAGFSSELLGIATDRGTHAGVLLTIKSRLDGAGRRTSVAGSDVAIVAIFAGLDVVVAADQSSTAVGGANARLSRTAESRLNLAGGRATIAGNGNRFRTVAGLARFDKPIAANRRGLNGAGRRTAIASGRVAVVALLRDTVPSFKDMVSANRTWDFVHARIGAAIAVDGVAIVARLRRHIEIAISANHTGWCGRILDAIVFAKVLGVVIPVVALLGAFLDAIAAETGL